MNCLDKVREMRPEFQKYSDAHIIHEFCPNEFGLHGLQQDDPDRCVFVNCTECWMREAVMLEGKDIPKEESMKETVEKLQKAGEALSLGYKEGIDEMHEVPRDMQFVTSKKPNEPRILDSGTRRQFETGAVRDICEGKGRCDLLPLDVVAEWLFHMREYSSHPESMKVLQCINGFQKTDDVTELFKALEYSYIFDNQYTFMLEVAKHFEEGCKKYGDNNWQKGIPTHCYIDSAVRHYLKYLRGDKDEPHDRAFCWNILCCIWTCIHKPELNDYATKKEESNAT